MHAIQKKCKNNRIICIKRKELLIHEKMFFTKLATQTLAKTRDSPGPSFLAKSSGISTDDDGGWGSDCFDESST